MLLCFPPQVPKPDKHGSGTDSDYDNTQTYDLSLRSDPLQVTVHKDECVLIYNPDSKKAGAKT